MFCCLQNISWQMHKKYGKKEHFKNIFKLKVQKVKNIWSLQNFLNVLAAVTIYCFQNIDYLALLFLACSGFPYYLVRKITSKNWFYILFGSCEKAALEKVGYPICVPNWATLFWYLWGCQPHLLAFVPSCSIII